MVQVQNDAATSFLIETDLLPQLGLVFLQKEMGGGDTCIYLLRVGKDNKLEAHYAPGKDVFCLCSTEQCKINLASTVYKGEVSASFCNGVVTSLQEY